MTDRDRARPQPKPAPISTPHTVGDATEAYSLEDIQKAMRRIDAIEKSSKRPAKPPVKQPLSWQAALVLIIACLAVAGLTAWIVFLVAQ